MSTDGSETERVSVSTYIPAYQRATWEAEAESMGVSRSEYVRLMVQAGRRSFELGDTDDSSPPPDTDDRSSEHTAGGSDAVTRHNSEKTRSSPSDPGDDGLEDRVLDLLDSDSYLGWDELVAGLTDDLEDRLEESLDSLQSAGRVRHSGRHGGYTVVADE
ncbi:DUF5805 domain-containing protein [Haloglomus salinum]|uniref:DUF5805 domain-containing protein n=1 Tax=Haloglomus salinum TaxID=2962673 RepID=UPI0020C94098|nr:DUF5805 domain-containing protein [Haloglomus salinum]